MGSDYTLEEGIQPLEPKDHEKYSHLGFLIGVIGEAFFAKKDMQDNFSKFDKNRNGVLEVEEIREMLLEKYQNKVKDFQEIIDSIKEHHPDATDVINEHVEAMNKEKKKIETIADKVEGFMAKYDKNADKKISFEEFLVYFQKQAVKMVVKGNDSIEEDAKLVKTFQAKLDLFYNETKVEDIQSQLDELHAEGHLLSFYWFKAHDLRVQVREKTEKDPKKIILANYFYLCNLFELNLSKDLKKMDDKSEFYYDAKSALESMKVLKDVVGKIIEILK